MSQLRFEVADVAGVRFRVSPVWETVSSLWALQSPVRHAVHLPWIDRARRVMRRPEVAARVRPLVELTRPRCWLPDFLTPPPSRPDVELAEQLDEIAATPPHVVVRDLLATTAQRPLGPYARTLRDDPRALLPELSRAALLHLLDTPATTTDLARRTGMSCANVSQHLAALHAAGLVTRVRQGRHVRYRGTEAATVLLRASRGA
jgi:DNA-binding transcriptional ArsR family regulator